MLGRVGAVGAWISQTIGMHDAPQHQGDIPGVAAWLPATHALRAMAASAVQRLDADGLASRVVGHCGNEHRMPWMKEV